jgi:hypothetical protein
MQKHGRNADGTYGKNHEHQHQLHFKSRGLIPWLHALTEPEQMLRLCP